MGKESQEEVDLIRFDLIKVCAKRVELSTNDAPTPSNTRLIFESTPPMGIV